MRVPLSVFLAAVNCWTASGQTYTISTFAGGGLPVNIPGTAASISPQSVAVDSAGNVFFSDGVENVVLKLDAKTGVLALVAGNGTCGFSGDNGLATSAQLCRPAGIAVDSAGNLYIADTGNNCVRKVSNGVITTVAGNGNYGFSGDNGPATSAQLYGPVGIAVDPAGNLYISDSGNDRIRKIANGMITTVAGNGSYGFRGDNGPATSAQLYGPAGVAVDPTGNLYISDSGNNRIRKVANGVITTVAGRGTSGFSGDGGPATSAQLQGPAGIAADPAGNLYISDSGNNRIRKVANGVITTVAGNGTAGFGGDGGPASNAQFNPAGLCVDSGGNLYIADSGNQRIRKVSNGVVSTVAGNGTAGFGGDGGPAAAAQLFAVQAVAVDSAGNVYIAEPARVRKVSSGVITTVAGNGTFGFSGDGGPATSAQFALYSPRGIAVDSAGNLFIADTQNSRVRKVSNGIVTTVAGNGTPGFSGDGGPAAGAQLSTPLGVAVDSAGNLYIMDVSNERIRKVSNGIITTMVGSGTPGYGGDGGPATSAQLLAVTAIAVDPAGNLYLVDSQRVRKVSNGVITTVAGSTAGGFFLGDDGPATDALLNSPTGLAVDSSGSIYIADTGNNRIRKVSNGVITTVAGNGIYGFGGDNGPATSAELEGTSLATSSGWGIAVDSAGNLYIADPGNARIRRASPGTAPVIAPGQVVPVYSSTPIVQPGSWVSVYGSDLASGTSLWNGDFPTNLGGTSVTIDGKSAYLWFVSPTQINLQVPDDATSGMVSVVVTTASGTATSTVMLAPQGPSFSLLGDGKHVVGEILTTNGTGAYGSYDLVGPSNTFSFSTRPVKAGEILVLFGVGFGPTNPTVPAGKVFSGAAPTVNPVTITIGGVEANVAFSGITEAGLYQFNLTVPNVATGDQALQATVNGVQTPSGPVVTVQ